MSECRMFHYSHHPWLPPQFAGQTSIAYAWCEAHQMPVDASGRCPIGRIEEATKEALERIKKEAEK